MVEVEPVDTRRPIAVLPRAEQARLIRLEDVLTTAQRWQAEAAKALVEIRDRKLYRAGYKSFEAYGQGRWGYEKSYLYMLCQWGETLANLSTIVDTLPTREAHARPLYSLSRRDQQRAWKAVLRRTSEPTARDVVEAAAAFRSPVSRRTTGALAYYGSKAALAPQIIAELPKHHCYVETHVGGASVLMAKPESPVEVMNDIDDALVTFYRVLREDREELVRRLRLTPYARTEWENCRRTCDDETLDDVERARRYYVAICQSYSATGTSFSRSNNKPQGIYWRDRIDRIDEVAERLRPVVVESLDAVDVVAKYDGPKTCFYVDPPYPADTRSGTRAAKYRHEMTDEQHEELLATLCRARGKVLVSGYSCDLYSESLRRWRVCWQHRVTCTSATSVNRGDAHHRVEVLWANW